MFRKSPKTVVYLFIFVFSFLVIFFPPGFFQGFKSGIVEILLNPIQIVRIPIKEFKKILYYHLIYDEYVRLRKENTTLERRMVGLEDVLLENSRLEDLLKLKRELVFSSIAANVIWRDPSSWHSSMVIDKGSEDGLMVGQPVVNASGVVGKIAEVGHNKSKVILVTDPSFSVAALINRSREVGLVSGSLRGICRMRYLDNDADVNPGDKIVTSKLSSSFPEGLLVGEVVSVQGSESSPTLDCLVRPAVSLSQIEEVLIIKVVHR